MSWYLIFRTSGKLEILTFGCRAKLKPNEKIKPPPFFVAFPQSRKKPRIDFISHRLSPIPYGPLKKKPNEVKKLGGLLFKG